MYMHEFPDYDRALTIPPGWEDGSWHNDTCPCIVRETKYHIYRIYQDYNDPELREIENVKQFAVYQDDEWIGEFDGIVGAQLCVAKLERMEVK